MSMTSLKSVISLAGIVVSSRDLRLRDGVLVGEILALTVFAQCAVRRRISVAVQIVMASDALDLARFSLDSASTMNAGSRS